MQTIIRTTLVVLVVLVVAVSVATAQPADADAIPRQPSRAPAGVAHDVPVRPGPVTRPSVAQKEQVEGGATGDGPADDATCERYAGEMQAFIDWASDLATAGDLDKAEGAVSIAESIQETGMSEGCFFTHPTSPE